MNRFNLICDFIYLLIFKITIINQINLGFN